MSNTERRFTTQEAVARIEVNSLVTEYKKFLSGLRRKPVVLATREEREMIGYLARIKAAENQGALRQVITLLEQQEKDTTRVKELLIKNFATERRTLPIGLEFKPFFARAVMETRFSDSPNLEIILACSNSVCTNLMNTYPTTKKFDIPTNGYL